MSPTATLWTRRQWLRCAAVGLAAPATAAARLQTAEPTTVVRGGQIVMPGRFRRADLLISGEKILAIGGPFDGDTVVEAGGLWVLPAGVDTHVHAASEWRHTAMRSFAELTSAALRGGTTTIVDFVVQKPGESLPRALDRKSGLARRGSLCDYAFHVLITDAAAALPGIGAAAASGARSFKLFMASPKALSDARILEIMTEVARYDGLVSVHAEDGSAIGALESSMGAGRALLPSDLPALRPPASEVEAVGRALRLAASAGVRLHLHHLSTGGALRLVDAARDRGQAVTVETCPHYLVLDRSVYERPDAWRYVVFPPLRESDDIAALWEGLAAGQVNSVASDDACFPLEQKRLGARSLTLAPPGGCGAGDRLRLMLDQAHFRRGLPVIQVARLIATGPAGIFGLAPRKGAVRVGADADLVLIDPQSRAPLETGSSPYSLFDDEPLQGLPVLTMRRGRVVVRKGRLPADAGPGTAL